VAKPIVLDDGGRTTAFARAEALVGLTAKEGGEERSLSGADVSV
jgi:hypothetical protein